MPRYIFIKQNIGCNKGNGYFADGKKLVYTVDWFTSS